MKKNVLVLALAGLLTSASAGGVAQAQIVELATDWRGNGIGYEYPAPAGAPSAKQIDYAQAVEHAVGGRLGTSVVEESRRREPTVRLRHVYTVGESTVRRTAHGLRISLILRGHCPESPCDGCRTPPHWCALTFERFVFESPKQAFDYALYGAYLTVEGAVEVWGNEVLVVRTMDASTSSVCSHGRLFPWPSGFLRYGWGPQPPQGSLTAKAQVRWVDHCLNLKLRTFRSDRTLDEQVDGSLDSFLRADHERLGARHLRTEIDSNTGYAVELKRMTTGTLVVLGRQKVTGHRVGAPQDQAVRKTPPGPRPGAKDHLHRVR